MAYLLQFHEKTVAPYLFDLDLSREGRVVLAATLHRELGLLADAYISNPQRRLVAGSDCFRVDLVFRDPGRQVVHRLHLVVSDAAARYGILRVVYAEDRTGPSGW